MKQLIRFVLRHVPRRYIQRVVHLCTPLVGLFTPGAGCSARCAATVTGNSCPTDTSIRVKMRCVRIAWRSSGTD